MGKPRQGRSCDAIGTSQIGRNRAGSRELLVAHEAQPNRQRFGLDVENPEAGNRPHGLDRIAVP
eukprot:4772862-Alexandrium_andersonii.AAC.1